MGTNIKPVVYCVNEDPGFLSNLKTKVKTDISDSDILLEYPTVYVHNWKRTAANPNGLYDVYIGESNDVIERTKEHYQASTDPNNWQYHLTNDGVTPKMYIIGHKHFNKSLTLDIENRLIHYISSMKNVDVVHNGRGNPQNDYYPSDEFEDIFHMIWSKLRKLDKNLFLSEAEIKDSAIFKASPLHKLTKEQIDAKNLIIDRVVNAINNNLTGQLIFVNGEAGTGKTVLNSSTFYELLDQGENPYTRDLKCCLMVNHDEQVSVYQEIAQRLKLTSKFGNDIVAKPTSFINNHSKDNMVDVAFVDEAHLLLTQGKQSYVEVVCAVIRNDNDEIFCCKRGPGRALEGFWEFPGGKVEPNETHEETIIREIKEELKSLIEPIRYIGVSNHEYKDLEKPFSITMYAYECKLISGELELTEHTEKQWVKDADLGKVNFAAADLPIVKLITK